MTTITPLPNGSECIKLVLSGGQDEVRVHLHSVKLGNLTGHIIKGLLIKNATRGVLYEEGEVAGECAS